MSEHTNEFNSDEFLRALDKIIRDMEVVNCHAAEEIAGSETRALIARLMLPKKD